MASCEVKALVEATLTSGGMLVEERLAVAELRSVFHLDRQSGVFLDHILPDESGMIRGPAGHDDETLDRAESPLHLAQSAQPSDAILGHESPQECIRETLRLFEDFLDHEVWVATLLGLFLRPFER